MSSSFNDGGVFNSGPIYSEDSGARSRIESVKDQFRLVENKIEKLKIVNQALWELIKERTSLEESDIIAKVKEIDGRDGKLDGKNRTESLECAKCSRTLRRGDSKCMYCGVETEFDSVFDWIR